MRSIVPLKRFICRTRTFCISTEFKVTSTGKCGQLFSENMANKNVISAINGDVGSSEIAQQQYVNSMKKEVKVFKETEKLVGRSEVVGLAAEVLSIPGSLVFICGGCSVGKSLVGRKVFQTLKEVDASGKRSVGVIHLDARGGSDIPDAMRKAIDGGPTIWNNERGSTSLNLAYLPLERKRTVQHTIHNFAELRADRVGHKVLILDEANKFLQLGGTCTGGTSVVARDLMDAIILNTKQPNRMSALLVSADDLPVHLKRLGVHPNHISDTIMVGEPSPQEALDWLYSLGVKEHLAKLLISVYGGNVHQLCGFLQRLPFLLRHEPGGICVQMQQVTNISAALSEWRREGNNTHELQCVLESLARTGFAPISHDDPVAGLLTRMDIACFLSAGAIEYHVPPSVRQQQEGLVPASQLTRVLIWWALDQEQRRGKFYAENNI